MIDSHCHLDHPPLFDKLDEVLERAKISGVKTILTISTSIKSFEAIKKIISKHKNIYGTIGIHPHETKDHDNVNKKTLLNLRGKNEKIIGIGETGLDFYYNNSDTEIQKNKFIEHIEAAIELDMPIIVHKHDRDVVFLMQNNPRRNNSLSYH